MIFRIYTYSRIRNEIILKLLQWKDVVPANVRAKRSKMLRSLSVKKRVLLRKPVGDKQVFCFEKIKKGTFTVLLKIT
jgi:hypothetical protein